MPKLSDFRGGSFLKAADLGNKEVPVHIESIEARLVGPEGDRKEKLVALFEGKTKGLVLNDSNLEVLELAFGPDTDDIVGGQVNLVRRSRCPLRWQEGRRHTDQVAEGCKTNGGTREEHRRRAQ
jgi:hypothetical protein